MAARDPGRLEGDGAAAVKPRQGLVAAGEDGVGGQQGALRVVAPLLVTLLHLAHEGVQLLGALLVVNDQGVVGQKIEQGGGLFEEEGEVILQAAGGVALGDLPVDEAALGVPLEGVPEGPAETGDPLLVEGELAGREHSHALHPVAGALGLGVEGADALELVVEQVEPVGPVGPHGVDVQQGAADRVLAVGHHLGDAVVAGVVEPPPQGVDVDPVPGREVEGVGVEKAAGGKALHQRPDGGDDHPLGEPGQPVQGRQALGDQLGQRREDVVGEGLPVREGEDRRFRRQEEPQAPLEGGGLLHVLRHHQHQAGVRLRGRRHQQHAGAAVQLPPLDALAGLCGHRGADRSRLRGGVGEG